MATSDVVDLVPAPSTCAELLQELRAKPTATLRDREEVGSLLGHLADRFTGSSARFGPDEDASHARSISEMRDGDGVALLVALLDLDGLDGPAMAHSETVLLQVCRVLFAMAALSEGKPVCSKSVGLRQSKIPSIMA